LVAIMAMLPFILLPWLEKYGGSKLVSAMTLPCFAVSGPAILLAGLTLEISQPEPDLLLVYRRIYEFVAAFAILIIVSKDAPIGAAIGAVISVVTALAYWIALPIDVAVLKTFSLTMMSSYIVFYIALAIIMRRRSDQESSKIDALTQIGASLAHELRTPLLSVKTRAQALERDLQTWIEHGTTKSSLQSSSTSTVLDAPRAIAAEATAASTLIDIFLVNASCNLTKEAPRQASFAIDNALNEAVSRFPYRSSREARMVKTDFQSNAQIQGQRLLLVHVAFNLIKNALASLPRTERHALCISSGANEKEASIRFEDNGAGIDRTDLPKIFDPFFSRSKGYGTGIGLAFCKLAIEEAFAGSIECESELGQYTRITITIPL